MKIHCCDELKMFHIHKSEDDGQSRSLVFKISRTTPKSEKESIEASDSSDNHKEISFNHGPVGTGLENNVNSGNTETAVEMPKSVVVKKENICQERRRSLRLLELENKLKLDAEIKKEEISDEHSTKRRNVPRKTESAKRNNSGRNFSKISKQIKREENSDSPQSFKESGKVAFVNARKQKKSLPDTRKLRLKSMVLLSNQTTPPCQNTSFISKDKSGIYPEFANVDQYLISAVTQKVNISSSLTPQKPVSLFFPKSPAHAVKPVQDCHASTKHCAFRYYLKKAKSDLLYLSKKYRMIDLSTLDICYGLCGGSLRKTQLMLLDMISGKEIIFPRNIPGLNSDDCFMNNDNYSNILRTCCNFPLKYRQFSKFQQSWERKLDETDPLNREIITQSLRILYEIETV